MFRKRKLSAFILALFIFLSGCGGNFPEQTTSAPTEAVLPEMSISCQLIPETVENPDDLPVLKWVCLVDDATVQSATEKVWTAEVGLEYTYCPESAMRPSNYMTVTRHSTLYKMNNSTTNRLVLSSGHLEDNTYGDCVVLEATGNFVIDYFTPNSSGEYAPNPIHVVNDTI